MSNSTTLNDKINTVHERALSIIYNDKMSSFKSLLAKKKTTPIHVKKFTISLSRDFQS